MQINDIRCGNCRRKLGEGTYLVLAIKCPRCGTLNHLPATRSQTGYRCELSQVQHVALLERLLSVQGMVMVAGYPSELYDDMLTGWRRIERPHRAQGSKRVRTEVLWLSPRCGQGAT